MTDLPPEPSIPSRLGVTLARSDEGLVATLVPTATVCREGLVRAAAYVFLVDVVAGLDVDTDPDLWTFTSDLSLRVPPRPAPASIDAVSRIVRSGARSITAEVILSGAEGEVGYSLVGFAKVGRRPDDPVKPDIDLAEAAARWSEIPVLEQPVREAAGIQSIDPGRGTVEIEVRPDLLNPAGALQGAMVALTAECAAEDLAEAVLGRAHVVTDLDIRFVAQARRGPVASRARFIGPPADGRIRVELVDRGHDDRLVTTVLVGVYPVPA